MKGAQNAGTQVSNIAVYVLFQNADCTKEKKPLRSPTVQRCRSVQYVCRNMKTKKDEESGVHIKKKIY